MQVKGRERWKTMTHPVSLQIKIEREKKRGNNGNSNIEQKNEITAIYFYYLSVYKCAQQALIDVYMYVYMYLNLLLFFVFLFFYCFKRNKKGNEDNKFVLKSAGKHISSDVTMLKCTAFIRRKENAQRVSFFFFFFCSSCFFYSLCMVRNL